MAAHAPKIDSLPDLSEDTQVEDFFDDSETVFQPTNQGEDSFDQLRDEDPFSQPQLEESQSEEPSSKKKLFLPILVAVFLVVVLLGAVYGGGCYYFSSRFFPHTTLNGQDISLQTIDDVSQDLAKEISEHTLSIGGCEISKEISADDVGLSVDSDKYAASAHSQLNIWTWPYEITQNHTLSATYTVSYDKNKLNELVGSIVSERAAEAGSVSTADIVFNEETSTLSFQNDYTRFFLDADAISSEISEALLSESQSLELSDDCISSDNAYSDLLDDANSYLTATCTLTANGEAMYEIGSEIIYSWLVIADDFSVSLNTDAINAWCTDTLSPMLNTIGSDRTYTRPDGKVCTVTDGSRAYGTSTYGWKVDTQNTASTIASALESRSSSSVEINAISSAARISDGGQDWPNRYIDLDLSEQHARFYNENSELIWEADVVSGQPNLGRSTPTGVWTITSRTYSYEGIHLRGPYDAETDTYEWDSVVSYWMGVVGSSIGFHDARNWRSSYGGSIYTYNGSHGCINISYDSAAALYELVQIGDVVVIHN